jgi:hypothetical protein
MCDPRCRWLDFLGCAEWLLHFVDVKWSVPGACFGCWPAALPFASGLTAGCVQWSINTATVVTAKPVIAAGFVYFITSGGILYCADEELGIVYVREFPAS